MRIGSSFVPMARYELDDHFGSQATQIAVGHNCPNTEVLGPLGVT